jgi:hypothetical protein
MLEKKYPELVQARKASSVARPMALRGQNVRISP